MLRLLQHNPETTAVPRQKPRRAATPETSREEEEEKKHDSEGWEMAPAGTIAFKHTHAGTEQSLCGFEAGL